MCYEKLHKILDLDRSFVTTCYKYYIYLYSTVGHAVTQLVEALRYKPEGRGFDARWCHCNFSLR